MADDIAGFIQTAGGSYEPPARAGGRRSRGGRAARRVAFTARDEARFAQAVGEAGPDRFYVYELRSADGEPFYIGKGQGLRVFDHMKHAMDAKYYIDSALPPSERREAEAELAPKLRKLVSEGAGYSPAIVKWGLTEDQAFAVESALINAESERRGREGLPPLTNAVAGHATPKEKASRAGVKSAVRSVRDFIEECAPEEIPPSALAGRRVVFVSLGWDFWRRCLRADGSADEAKVRDCARGLWRISLAKARRAEYVVALHRMRVVGAFRVARPPEKIESERAGGLPGFPDFPPDVRRMDYMKCAFPSLAAAECALPPADYADLEADLLENGKGRPPAESYTKLQRTRVYFCVGGELQADVAGCVGKVLTGPEADAMSRRFRRNPVLLNYN